MPGRRRLLVYLIPLVVAAAPRLFLAVTERGLYWPDELFNSIEPAHRFAFGFGHVSWEYNEGIRPWVFPGAMGLLFKLLAALGLASGPALLFISKLLVTLGGVAAVYFVMRLAEKRGGEPAALLAGLISAALPPWLALGHHTFTEVAAAPLVAAAAFLLDERPALAGLLAGGACLFRYQTGLVMVVFGVTLLLRRQYRAALRFAAGAVAAGLVGGTVDWITYGAPFLAFVRYLRFMLANGGGKQWGVEPGGFYFVTLWTSIGVAAVPLAAGILLALRRAPELVAAVLLTLLAHERVPHKELRFIFPVLPLFACAAGIGLAWLCRGKLLPAAAAGVALAAIMAVHAPGLTFADLGQWRHKPAIGQRSIYHWKEGSLRMFFTAGRRPDLCGLSVTTVPWEWSGGFISLRRDVPVVYRSDLSVANYFIGSPDHPPGQGWLQVDRSDDAALYRREGDCAPPPPGYTTLHTR